MNGVIDAIATWGTGHVLILGIVVWRIVLAVIALFCNAYEYAIERGEQKEREGSE